MPIHNWSAVNPAYFHDFHFSWLAEIRRALYHGHLPPGFYALSQHQFEVESDQREVGDDADGNDAPILGGQNLANEAPKVTYHFRGWPRYLTNSIAVRCERTGKLIAMIEIISQHNKDTNKHLREIVEKVQKNLQSGVHVLVIDLIAPNKFNPEGIHPAIWDDISGNVGSGAEAFCLPKNKRLTLASYLANRNSPTAFVEPTGLGEDLADMPLFLDADHYFMVPLEATYQAAFQSIAEYCRGIVEDASKPNDGSSGKSHRLYITINVRTCTGFCPDFR